MGLPYRLRRALGGYDARMVIATLLSFVACSWLIVRIDSPSTGDLANKFSDHIHHLIASWTFWQKGFGVYHGAYRDTAAPGYPHYVGVVPWPDMPVTYPVGMFAFFAPPMILGRYVTMTTATLGKITILWLVLTTHLGFFGVGRALRKIPDFRLPILVVVWLLYVRMCLHGFYDGAWVGCGAMSIAALADRRLHASLLWFSAAAFMSLKASSFGPVAAAAAVLLLVAQEPLWKKVATFGVVGAVSLHGLWVVRVTFKYLPKEGTPVWESAKSSLLPIAAPAYIVIAAGIVVALLLVWYRQFLTAASVLFGTSITINHAGHSWHGAVLIASVLLAGAVEKKNVGIARQILLLWMVGVLQFAYWHPPFAIFEDVIPHLKRIK